MRVDPVDSQRDSEELFRRYVLEVESFWSGKMQRQAEKLQRQVDVVCERSGLTPEQLVDRVLNLARDREPDPPPPVYVTGLGSSGSHWLAGMLAELPQFADVGEVYFSAMLREELGKLPRESQRLVTDAVQLLHGLSREPQIEHRSTVNSAAGAYELELYKAWDPRSVVVYLYRDPRDQVLSATFRKDEYRNYQAPGADDVEYLLRMCARNRADHGRYRRLELRADLEISYEDLREEPTRHLERIAEVAGVRVGSDALERVAFRHDAENIRAGKVADKGNLDLGGRARGWQNDASRQLRQILHVELAEVVSSLGYPLVECISAADGMGHPHRVATQPGARTFRSSVQCAAGLKGLTDRDVLDLLRLEPEALDLSRTAVTDGAVDALIDAPGLRVLGLAGTSISADSIRRLREARADLIVLDQA